MCFTAKPEVVCELSTRYEAAISISEASCMGCSSLCRWDAVAECRFVQQVQNTLPDQEQWISTCCRGVHAVAEARSSCSGQPRPGTRKDGVTEPRLSVPSPSLCIRTESVSTAELLLKGAAAGGAFD